MSANGRGRTGWAGGRPRGLLGDRPAPGRAAQAPVAASLPVETEARAAADPETVTRPVIATEGANSASYAGPIASAGPAIAPAERVASLASRVPELAAEWAPTLGRIALGLVFAWFGYHELEHPGNWTGYVPILSETSNLAIIAVIAHGWVLFVLAVALVAGISPRLAAALATVIMLEIVISLAVTGLTDTALRDLGVLGLAVCLTGAKNHRLMLRG